MRWLRREVSFGEGKLEGMLTNLQNNKMRLEVESAVASEHTEAQVNYLNLFK